MCYCPAAMKERLENYFDILGRLPVLTVATDAAGNRVAFAEAMQWAVRCAAETHDSGNTILFIGNGGSAGITSHMAIDFSKCGDMRATCFNDGSALTCLGNDLGYDQVFAHPVRMHGRPGDLLVAISSSGRSPNILNGVSAGRERGLKILTLSGFAPDNPLRAMGDVNLYVESSVYGFVEVTHMALLHAVLDLKVGWDGQR